MRRLLVAVLVLLALSLALLIRPLAPRGLEPHPRPAADYAAALRIVDSLRAADDATVGPGCGTTLLTHGARAAHAVVLLHGLTNCPAQFDSLARLVYARGANVLIPRLPRHGLADRMTDELGRLDARELCDLTDRAVDAACGLGDSVTVAGLSTGGVMAAWAGQFRPEVARVVVIAPMLGWARAPGPLLTAALARTACELPNRFVWWDDRLRERLRGPRHVYPRFATRAIAATMLAGGAVTEAADLAAPDARRRVMVTVGGDPAADNGAAAALVRAWRAHGARAVETFEFPAALHLNHDVVDPEQVGGDPRRTYPVLLRLIDP